MGSQLGTNFPIGALKNCVIEVGLYDPDRGYLDDIESETWISLLIVAEIINDFYGIMFIVLMQLVFISRF